MIAPNSEYASKTGSFKKLMSQIENSDKDYANKRTIIVSEGLSRNITKALPTIPSHPESYPYDIFMTEVPRHRCHYLRDGQFVFERLTELPAELVARFVTIDMLPKIPTSSPLAVWCGLKRGDIFMYDALSETSGVEKIIRLVE
jgi:DNA-directed RNA polymerase subunit H (RpoH/RPB5)